MEEIEIRLNNFLFNSGVLGFYRILKHCGKENLIEKQGNILKVKKEVFQDFDKNYIETMLYEYRKSTRWYSIVSSKERIEGLDLETEKGQKDFKDIFDFLKKSIESASYKSAYEIVKLDEDKLEIYELLEIAKKEKGFNEKKRLALELIKFLEEHEEVYAMKDIIYNKINIFWENVSFLNKNSNRNRIKEEYNKSFIEPVKKYIEIKQKSDFNCIECGNVISKTEAVSMSWLENVGVDINRKKSGFWNFNEDAFLCPICNLIYSCVPLGFYIPTSNGVFINSNNSIEMLIQENNQIRKMVEIEKDNLSEIQHRMFYQFLKSSNQKENEVISKEEPQNIQVVKRIVEDKDKPRYEFTTISKEKLGIFDKTKEKFESLLNRLIILNKDKAENRKYINIYEEVISNFLENRKQYKLLDLIINYGATNNTNIIYALNIVKIQLYCIGGIEVKEMTEQIEEMRKAGEYLQKFYHVSDENDNKLKAYILNLANSLRTNNVTMFMDIVTRMYGSLGKSIPCVTAFERMLKEEESFRLLGYAYVIGLEGYTGKKEENKGGNEDEK